MIVIDRAAYAEANDVSVEQLDPLPFVSMGTSDTVVFPFLLGLPDGSGGFYASWSVPEPMTLTHGVVRYGNFKPRWIPLRSSVYAEASDIVSLRYNPHFQKGR